MCTRFYTGGLVPQKKQEGNLEKLIAAYRAEKFPVRNISFALTTPQFFDRIKDVTRRLGWDNLKPGDILCAVEKGMGLKKGEKVKRLGLIKVVSCWPEPLEAITQEEVMREGFPAWTPEQFVEFFCNHNKVEPQTIVNRIEYAYLD